MDHEDKSLTEIFNELTKAWDHFEAVVKEMYA